MKTHTVIKKETDKMTKKVRVIFLINYSILLYKITLILNLFSRYYIFTIIINAK